MNRRQIAGSPSEQGGVTMGRYDHPCYRNTDRVPRSRHHHNARAQASPVSATEVDAATRSGAIRPAAPVGRVAHHRQIGARLTVAFLSLLTLVVLAQSCDPNPATSLFCAEKFCGPLAP